MQLLPKKGVNTVEKQKCIEIIVILKRCIMTRLEMEKITES